MPAECAPPTDILLLLTAVAGAMDALSYLTAHVFTANMTGNTVVLGLAIAGADRSRWVPACVSLAAFAFGAALAAVVLVRRGQKLDQARDLKFGTVLEFPFTAGFAVLTWVAPGAHSNWLTQALIGTAACSLGIQSVAVRRLKMSGVVTTFITGTITTAIVSMITNTNEATQEDAARRTSPSILPSMFLLYIAAAAVAAWIASAHHFRAATFIPLGLMILVIFRSWTLSAER